MVAQTSCLHQLHGRSLLGGLSVPQALATRLPQESSVGSWVGVLAQTSFSHDDGPGSAEVVLVLDEDETASLLAAVLLHPLVPGRDQLLASSASLGDFVAAELDRHQLVDLQILVRLLDLQLSKAETQIQGQGRPFG